MKQLYTFFLFVFAFAASAQSLSLISQDTLVEGEAANMDELVAYVTVKNNSSQSIDYKVKRLDHLGYNGLTDSNAICWESCFLPTVSVSPTTLTIDPGQHSSMLPGGGFSGHVYPDGDGQNREGTITYRFFNVADTTDFLDVVVKYRVVKGLSSREFSASPYKVSVYPNPVVGKATIEYSFTESGQKSFELFNLLGTKVYGRILPNMEGSFSIDGTKFSKGVYFYVLKNNGKAMETRKIIFK